ncbi:hypothetical protein K438DRAFT_2025653 [Mycena galopus ATCC 62051]|nr:hypothetical protein K438DRAFT_2025653 [Mycena galopus ATCC 62051]
MAGSPLSPRAPSPLYPRRLHRLPVVQSHSPLGLSALAASASNAPASAKTRPICVGGVSGGKGQARAHLACPRVTHADAFKLLMRGGDRRRSRCPPPPSLPRLLRLLQSTVECHLPPYSTSKLLLRTHAHRGVAHKRPGKRTTSHLSGATPRPTRPPLRAVDSPAPSYPAHSARTVRNAVDILLAADEGRRRSEATRGGEAWATRRASSSGGEGCESGYVRHEGRSVEDK